MIEKIIKICICLTKCKLQMSLQQDNNEQINCPLHTGKIICQNHDKLTL